MENNELHGIIDEKTGKLIDAGTKEELKKKINLEQAKVNIRYSYDEIKEVLEKYIDTKPEYYEIIALWIIGTYFHDEFENYPYLFFNAMKGSGKSRTLKLISSMSKNGIYSMSPTESVLFRTTGTLCLDEIESIGSKEKQSIREILNASYKKGVVIMRMKKKRTKEGESQIVEEFEPYRPICMANIWGMEEVLGDRSINLILEKSNHPIKTRLIEDFDNEPKILDIKTKLGIFLDKETTEYNKIIKNTNISQKWNEYLINRYAEMDENNYNFINQCSLCGVVTQKNNIHNNEKRDNLITTHNYINLKETLITQTTNNNLITTHNYINLKESQTTQTVYNKIKLNSFFNKIFDTDIKGRNLELFMPLFLISYLISDDVFTRILTISKEITNEKIKNEETESVDVLVYDYISNLSPSEYYTIKELTMNFRQFSDETSEWLNPKWFGRALKRLNLIIDKRRLGHGIEVRINPKKAKEKSEIFKTKIIKENEQENI